MPRHGVEWAVVGMLLSIGPGNLISNGQKMCHIEVPYCPKIQVAVGDTKFVTLFRRRPCDQTAASPSAHFPRP